MNKKPLISIVLPVYNVEKYIDRCFQSVKGQSYQNLEIIFVDDGSTDSSADKCEAYAKQDPRVVVYHKENGGLSDARNYGIDRIHGEYVTFVDSDDYIDKDYVSYLLYLIKKYNTKLSICQHRTRFQNGLVKDTSSQTECKMTAEKCLEKLMYNDGIDTSAYSKLISREILSEIYFPKGKIFEDLATMYKFIIRAEEVAVGNQAKYNYMFHSNSISNDKFNPQYLDYSKITDKMVKDCVSAFPRLEKAGWDKKVRSRLSVIDLLINTGADERLGDQRKKMIEYVRSNNKHLKGNPKVSRRDKVAIALIMTCYPLYKKIWKMHRKRIMN